MKKLKYIIFILFLIFFITPKTYAYQSTTSSYDVITQDYNSMLSSQSCNNTSLLDYFQYIINSVDWSTSYYQVFTTLPTSYNTQNYNGYKVSMYLIPSSQIQNDYLLYRATNSANQVGMSYQYGFNISPYYNTYNRRVDFQLSVGVNSTPCNLNTSDYRNDLATLNLIDLLQNNHITTSESYYLVNDYVNLSYNNNDSTYASFFQQSASSITNNASYNTSLWYYYSSFKYRYPPTDMSGNTFWYYKNINLVNENKSYTIGDYLDSYYDLNTPYNPQYIGYQTSLQTFYTNIAVNNLSTYNLKVKFNTPSSVLGFSQTPQEYIDNTSFDYYCSGRLSYDNGNYFSYDSFPCSLTSSYTTSQNTIEYTFNNVTTSSILTNYDKIYVTIKTNYNDPNVSTTIYNYSYNFNGRSFYNTAYKGTIYEDITGLPLNFKLYLSSNISSVNSLVYIDSKNLSSDIKIAGYSNTNFKQVSVVGQSILGKTLEGYNFENQDFYGASVTNSNDTGLLIYQDNGSVALSELRLFFNEGIYISLDSLGNNSFYYIDSSGNISIGNFEKPTPKENKYDISYYMGEVSDYINDLSSDTLKVSVMVQDFYNGLPSSLQNIIFILFILSNVCFVIYLIRS